MAIVNKFPLFFLPRKCGTHRWVHVMYILHTSIATFLYCYTQHNYIKYVRTYMLIKYIFLSYTYTPCLTDLFFELTNWNNYIVQTSDTHGHIVLFSSNVFLKEMKEAVLSSWVDLGATKLVYFNHQHRYRYYLPNLFSMKDFGFFLLKQGANVHTFESGVRHKAIDVPPV